MAFRLDDLVIAGEFFNTGPLSFHGRLALRGSEMTISVGLTGSPSEDLRGRGFEFEVPENDRPPTKEDLKRIKSFANQQIGTTGDITAAGTVKTFDCSPEEFYERSAAGDPPPVRLVRRLYMEWFSQNGRVVLELADPKLKFLDLKGEPVETEDFVPHLDEPAGVTEPEITVIHADDEIDPLEEFSLEDDEPSHGEDDEYGLFPKDLNRELERSSRRTDREIAGEPEDEDDPLADIKKFERITEQGRGTPFAKLFEGLNLPPPNAPLSEEQFEQSLKVALAQIALYCIAFDVCKHCSAAEAYRILMEEVGQEETFYPQMRSSSFVQHFATSDYCKKCQE